MYFMGGDSRVNEIKDDCNLTKLPDGIGCHRNVFLFSERVIAIALVMYTVQCDCVSGSGSGIVVSRTSR